MFMLPLRKGLKYLKITFKCFFISSAVCLLYQFFNFLPIAFGLFCLLSKGENSATFISSQNNETVAQILQSRPANLAVIPKYRGIKEAYPTPVMPPVVIEPCILHQTSTNSTVPKRWERYVNKVIERRGDFCQYIHWTDETMRKFIVDHYPWFLQVYDGYWYEIQRVDAFRYFALYHFGGIYLDMDIGLQQNLDFFTRFPLVLPTTQPIGFSNDFIAAKKHHPFMKYLIEHLASWDRWYLQPYLTVMFSTGPLFLTFQHALAPSHITKDVHTLDFQLYGANSFHFIHGPGSSWHQNDGEMLLTFYPIIVRTFYLCIAKHCYWKYLLSILILFVVVLIFIRRQKRWPRKMFANVKIM